MIRGGGLPCEKSLHAKGLLVLSAIDMRKPCLSSAIG